MSSYPNLKSSNADDKISRHPFSHDHHLLAACKGRSECQAYRLSVNKNRQAGRDGWIHGDHIDAVNGLANNMAR